MRRKSRAGTIFISNFLVQQRVSDKDFSFLKKEFDWVGRIKIFQGLKSTTCYSVRFLFRDNYETHHNTTTTPVGLIAVKEVKTSMSLDCTKNIEILNILVTFFHLLKLHKLEKTEFSSIW